MITKAYPDNLCPFCSAKRVTQNHFTIPLIVIEIYECGCELSFDSIRFCGNALSQVDYYMTTVESMCERRMFGF